MLQWSVQVCVLTFCALQSPLIPFQFFEICHLWCWPVRGLAWSFHVLLQPIHFPYTIGLKTVFQSQWWKDRWGGASPLMPRRGTATVHRNTGTDSVVEILRTSLAVFNSGLGRWTSIVLPWQFELVPATSVCPLTPNPLGSRFALLQLFKRIGIFSHAAHSRRRHA